MINYDNSPKVRVSSSYCHPTLLLACPLVFLDITEIPEECGDQVNNETSCSNATESYMSRKSKALLLTCLV